MSPEQVVGKKVDRRSDIFSLGCILYEILTGRRPFEAESITTVIYKIINEEPLPLIEVKKGLPVGFEQIITKALAKDPNDRYQSCVELAADLRAIHAMADKTIAITMAKEELPRVEVRKKRRLGPALIAALVTVVVLAVAGTLYVFQTTGKIPFVSGGSQKAKVEKPPAIPQPGALAAGSVEDKLNKARESFDRGDYGQAAKLAEKILAADPSNLAAKELLTKAQSNINKPLTAQVSAKEEPKAGKTLTSPKPKETAPGPTEKKGVEAQPTSTTTSPLKTVVPGSVEDKLNRAKENFEKKNYAETIRLAKDILAVDVANVQAQEYRDKGEAKLKEAARIAQFLKDGISFYENEDYEQCLQKTEEVLKLDKANADALKYKELAEKAIYEQGAKEEIKQVIEHQRKAEETKDFGLLIRDIGSDDLRQGKQDFAKLAFNLYDQIKWSMPSNTQVKFKDKNHAEVSFVYISTAVYKKTGSRTNMFEGVRIWTMEKKDDAWKIIKEGKK
jgi:tetratricopeptide (TPR) repeat protein